MWAHRKPQKTKVSTGFMQMFYQAQLAELLCVANLRLGEAEAPWGVALPKKMRMALKADSPFFWNCKRWMNTFIL